MAGPNSQRRAVPCLVLVLALALSAACLGQDANDSGWQAQALARYMRDADLAQLEVDRILITDLSFTQIYQAYPNPLGPSFITSDSLLNAYHVLYEESVLRLEQAGSRRLPEILRFILANLDTACAGVQGQAELMTAARERAAIVVGTALKLLDDESTLADETVMAIIDEEVARIGAAEEKMMPDWLGPSTPDFMAVDYTRFKVRGFYTRSDALTRYFQAVAWLQSIPFRVSHDDELLTILILGRCLAPERFAGDIETHEAYLSYFRTYTEFLGVGDDWDLVTAADAVASGLDFDLEAERTKLMAQAEQEGGPQISDQLRFAPDEPNAVAEPNFRIISAYRLPDAVLFQRTTDIRQFRERSFPNGLEVCIALGSTFARETIDDAEKDKLLATIDTNLDLFAGTSLYFDYLHAVAALLDAPEPNAPAFMAAGPWQAKSCGTALAGWAQLRHTWVLQAKLNISSWGGGLRHPPSGFVEPEPEFFSRMAHLAARTGALLAQAGAFGTNYFSLINTLNQVADLLDQAADLEAFWASLQLLWDAQDPRLLHVTWLVDGLEGDTESRSEQLRHMAADLEQGILPASLAWMTEPYDSDVEQLWPKLETMSRHLESIARKQLAGSDIDADDEKFIKGYGASLAAIMLYDGNYSAQFPEDDAPRIADVYSNPVVGGNLHVGIGRARALYVLYPWDADVVLCRGAVMPYYEFVDSGRLTDEQWKARLDSNARPDVPDWLRLIIGAEGLSAPPAETIGRR